jgi:hypothetical protein
LFPAQQQIAVKAATQQRCVAQALAVLRGAPDLADAVSAGEMGLGKGIPGAERAQAHKGPG